MIIMNVVQHHYLYHIKENKAHYQQRYVVFEAQKLAINIKRGFFLCMW